LGSGPYYPPHMGDVVGVVAVWVMRVGGPESVPGLWLAVYVGDVPWATFTHVSSPSQTIGKGERGPLPSSP
jgi:hypothetical protein